MTWTWHPVAHRGCSGALIDICNKLAEGEGLPAAFTASLENPSKTGPRHRLRYIRMYFAGYLPSMAAPPSAAAPMP